MLIAQGRFFIIAGWWLDFAFIYVGILFGFAYGSICTIVTKDDIRNIRLGELETFLTNQNYPKKLINNGIEKAKKLTIEELRNPKKKSDNNNNKTLPLVITHNPNNPQIVNIVRQSMNFLRHSKKMESTLKNIDLIVSRRQPKNLKQILTKAEFSNSAIKRGVTKCNEPRCGTCNIIVTGDSLILKGNKTWDIHSPMSCLSRDVIYIIIFSKCQDYYIGQTENLRNRVTLHKKQIKHEQYRHLPVSKHLQGTGGIYIYISAFVLTISDLLLSKQLFFFFQNTNFFVQTSITSFGSSRVRNRLFYYGPFYREICFVLL